MLKKTERTIEKYKKAGAMMRLYKTLGSKLMVEISGVLSAADQDKMMRAMRRIDEVSSNAEDNMFRDFPQLSDRCIDVFYGATDMEPRGEVDTEIIALSKEVADGLTK